MAKLSAAGSVGVVMEADANALGSEDGVVMISEDCIGFAVVGGRGVPPPSKAEIGEIVKSSTS